MVIPTEAGAEVHRRQLRALLDLARSSFEATKGTSPDLSHILEASATVLEAPGYCALVEGQFALFAELAGDNIVRLWRLGGGSPGARPDKCRE